MTYIAKIPAQQTGVPTRRELDNMLKRMALLRKQAATMSPGAPIRDRLLMQARIKDALEELSEAQKAVQERLSVVQERRAAAQAYLNATNLRIMPQRHAKRPMAHR